jgi:hypothetical protein
VLASHFRGTQTESALFHRGKMTTKEKTQFTPKGEEISIPKRGDFLKNLKKAASPQKASRNRPKK